MKEKLQNEVTKIKEELEKHLSEYNQMIRENEKLKGIKIIKKEEENMIKVLSYVSKINKDKKIMKLMSSEMLKNLNISFQEKENI